jgi:hypothetical protein
MQKVMESVRHPPALYWAVVSAAALCWGTSVLAKRRGTTPLRRLKRARKHYSGKLRPFLEDFVYGTMALINSFIGALYWILDLFYEGRPPKNKNYIPIISDSSLSKTTTVSEKNLVMMDCSNHMNNTQQTQQVLYKPRRGAIMRLRTRLVKINALRGRRQTCGCWGWVVEDVVTSSPELVCDGDDKGDDALWVSCSAKKPDSHQVMILILTRCIQDVLNPLSPCEQRCVGSESRIFRIRSLTYTRSTPQFCTYLGS